ncbi:MAG: hypothetical protein HYU57_00025 [Micavibrio aeruginosavorus]|nr:hypothetical protein [Micavibrio aeruginosavorus]
MFFRRSRISACGTVLFFLVAACAPLTSTTGSSVTDPAYRGGAFHALAVEAETGLQERDSIERSAAAALNQADVQARISLDILPPTRDYGQAGRRRAMIASGAEGLLVITPGRKQVIENYIPPSYFPRYGGYGHYHPHDRYGFSAGFYEPGTILRQPQATYTASIYALPGFDRVWTAELTTQGSYDMDFNTLGARFAEGLVARLVQDGMIAGRIIPPETPAPSP